MGSETILVFTFLSSLLALSRHSGPSPAPSLSFDCSVFPDSSWFPASDLSFQWSSAFCWGTASIQPSPRIIYFILRFSQSPLEGQLGQEGWCLPLMCVNPKSPVLQFSLALMIAGVKGSLEVCRKEASTIVQREVTTYQTGGQNEIPTVVSCQCLKI